MQKKAAAFFETHPEVNTVYGVLGTLFVELEKAERFAGGTSAKPETFTREQFTVDTPAEEPTAPVIETSTETVKEELVKQVKQEAPVKLKSKKK